MPSGIIGKVVATNIAEALLGRSHGFQKKASMGKMGAACIISLGYGLSQGMAATLTVSPVVPDWPRYPEWGRDLHYTVGKMGLSGHWMKWLMHYMFLYKARARTFWWMIPE
jgi:sulfide:quinone oxidoreductase